MLCLTGIVLGLSACATVARPAATPTPAPVRGQTTIPAGIDPFTPGRSALHAR